MVDAENRNSQIKSHHSLMTARLQKEVTLITMGLNSSFTVQIAKLSLMQTRINTFKYNRMSPLPNQPMYLSNASGDPSTGAWQLPDLRNAA